MSILIKNGRVLDPANKVDELMDVYIEDGKIISLNKNIDITAKNVIDANNMWVVPGLIDVHTHLREPGFEHKETILSGTRSAAKGGFTTICCMPNTDPVIDNEIIACYIKMKAEKEGIVNVLPIGAITSGQKGESLSNIGQMVKAGLCAISEDGKSVLHAGLLKTAMKYASMFNIPVFSHCEDETLTNSGQMNSGAYSQILGLSGISNDSEEVIVSRDIIIARNTKVRLHICHISTKGSVELIRSAKREGGQVTAEVCPHHFTLTEEFVEGYNTNAKMNPPLRTAADVIAIKKGLADGTIDIIATDHAPHCIDDKNCEFAKAAFGIVGLETAVSLAITELVNKNYLDPYQLICKMSYNPAKLLNIDKGNLKAGKIADVTIIDPNADVKVDVNKFESKSKNSPFDGFELKGKIMYTIVNGKIVVNEGEVLDDN